MRNQPDESRGISSNGKLHELELTTGRAVIHLMRLMESLFAQQRVRLSRQGDCVVDDQSRLQLVHTQSTLQHEMECIKSKQRQMKS
jgi:hypothetical protein